MVAVRRALFLLALFSVNAAAQRPDGVTLTAAAVWLESGGRDLGDLSLGRGVELELRYSGDLRRGISLAVAFQSLRHSGVRWMQVHSLVFEPRYAFGTRGSPVVPYVAARHSHVSWRRGGSGASLGAGLGIVWRLQGRMHVETAFGFSVTYIAPTTFPKTPNGTGFTLRLGLGGVL